MTKTRVYDVCAQFLVPHYVHIRVRARNKKEALVLARKAEEEHSTVWEHQEKDYDCSRPTTFHIANYEADPDLDLSEEDEP